MEIINLEDKYHLIASDTVNNQYIVCNFLRVFVLSTWLKKIPIHTTISWARSPQAFKLQFNLFRLNPF
jgi:hypothetical protein